jgi:hypothetical protein
MYRSLLLLLLASPAVAVEPLVKLKPFLESHCISCHSNDNKSGGLNLEQHLRSSLDEQSLAKWVRIHDRVQSGEMPPAKRPRPKSSDTQEMLNEVGQLISKVQLQEQATSGRSTLRRLNRTEYENTLRDLLDLPALRVKELLPEDGRVLGYDRSATALDISPILLSKYDEAVDVALDAAIAQWTVPPASIRLRMYAHHNYDFLVVVPNGDGVMLKDMKYDDSRFPIPKTKYAEGKFELGQLDRSAIWQEPGTTGLFRCLGESFAGRFGRFSPVYPGKYRISASVWSFWWNKGEVQPSPRTQTAGIYYGNRPLGFFDAPSLKPTGHTWEEYLEPGEHLKFDPASLWEVHVYSKQGKAAGFVGPGVAIDHLDVEGPIHEEWPPTSHKRLFGDLPLVPFSKLEPKAPRPARKTPRQTSINARNGADHHTFGTINPDSPIASAEKLLREFLPRAFRRPITPAEQARYVGIAVQRLADGQCFEDAMRAAYKAILCSPEFLFLREPLGPLDSWAIASRLSYTLWNSLPDEELLKLAEKNQLREPSVLKQQIDRLLRDPRSDRFVNDFLDQWLDLRDLDSTSPDRTLYPEYNAHLRDAIQKEPRLYFRKLLNENRPVSYLVRSDFMLLNQRLAEHYQISGVQGNRFEARGVPAGTHRGGLLTQAAILKVTANGTTTSPVKRGAWVMRKLLGLPPEPPPPDIPAVEPDVRGATTIREQLAKHRDNASCASCHAKMDPPGFALESFDVIGGYRERYRATQGPQAPSLTTLFPSHLDREGAFPGMYHVGFRQGLPVDASGELLAGQRFKHVDEFRHYLASQDRQLGRNFINQIAIYSTGTPIRFVDRPLAENLLNQSQLGIRSMLVEWLQSSLFLSK